MSSEAGAFKVGLVQMAMSAGPAENVGRRWPGWARPRARGRQVVCLPELFRSPYFCQKEDAALFDLAEPVPGPTHRAPSAAPRRSAGVAVVAPIFERRAPGLYHNSAVVIDADGEVARPLPQDAHPGRPALLREVLLHARRPRLPRLRHAGGRIGHAHLLGPVVSRRARGSRRSQGALVLFYPTAIGWHPSEKAEYGAAQRDAWRTIQRAHAIANGVYVAAVNRVGHEIPPEGGPGLEFWGTIVRRRSVRRGGGRGVHGQGRDPGRRGATWRASRRCGATGPSSATAASTPTPGIDRRFLD